MSSKGGSLPRWRATADVKDLARHATRAVKAAERILYDSYADGDRDMALKAVTRLTQAVQAHTKVLELADLADRLEALESAVERLNERSGGQ